MKLSWETATLKLVSPFRIAHGTSAQRETVFVKLDEGVGEAAVVPYYGESTAGIIEYLSGLKTTDWDVFQSETIIQGLPPGSQAARAAIDIALYDLWGKRSGSPLFKLFGLDPDKIPQTSFTISIDEPVVMAEKASKSIWPILKVKLGEQDDEAVIAAIRKATQARLRVDANAGWSREQAVDLIPRLAQYDLELVEQPLPVGDIEGLRILRSLNLGVPIFADENVKTARDVAAHAGAVDGVVVKLMKCGGIHEALHAIETAKSLDMQVMISCVVESSLGVTAAAHIAPLCDFVDLDAPLLIENDPYQGVSYMGANLVLPHTPGVGVMQKEG